MREVTARRFIAWELCYIFLLPGRLLPVRGNASKQLSTNVAADTDFSPVPFFLPFLRHFKHRQPEGGSDAYIFTNDGSASMNADYEGKINSYLLFCTRRETNSVYCRANSR